MTKRTKLQLTDAPPATTPADAPPADASNEGEITEAPAPWRKPAEPATLAFARSLGTDGVPATKECVDCHRVLPVTDFGKYSPRCRTCHGRRISSAVTGRNAAKEGATANLARLKTEPAPVTEDIALAPKAARSARNAELLAAVNRVVVIGGPLGILSIAIDLESGSFKVVTAQSYSCDSARLVK